jgi:hypothetical protein
MTVVLGIIAKILLIEVHLVKLIKHTTKQPKRFPQMGAIQQAKGRYMPVIGPMGVSDRKRYLTSPSHFLVMIIRN